MLLHVCSCTVCIHPRGTLGPCNFTLWNLHSAVGVMIMKEENSRIDIRDILSLFLLYSFLLSGCGALDAFLMNDS